MQNFDLKLTLNDVNLILNALGNSPYVSVVDLIAKIREQITPQLNSSANEESE
jgi:hypothetical protein